jgi:GNAT superfamily N-acetyltransferase
MCTDISLVPVSREHLTAIFELLQDVSTFRPVETQVEEVWREFSKQSHVHALVAVKNGRVVGYGSVSFETRVRGGRVGRLEDIVSAFDCRGLGVGRKIVEALTDIASQHGCFKITLQCAKKNVMFYEKCLYSDSGVTMQLFLGAGK